MIPGLIARHRWITPTVAGTLTLPDDLPDPTDANSVMLNQRLDDSGNRPDTLYRVSRISGLHSAGESAASTQERVRAEGEIPRAGFRRGKTITYEGRIEAPTDFELGQAIGDLSAAFADQSAEGLMIVSYHPNYTGSGDGDFFYYPALALAVEIEEAFADPRRLSRGHEATFAVAVRVSRTGGYSYYNSTGVGHA